MLKKSLHKDIKVLPHFKLINTMLLLLFLIGLALTVWEIEIYENTFIPLSIPLGIWIVTGLIVTPFLRKVLSSYFMTPFLFQPLYNVLSFGGIALFLFMWLNYHCAGKKTIVVNAKVMSIGHLAEGEFGSCEQPYVIINYKGQKKQLLFYCGDRVEQYKSVDMIIELGLFGFEIVTCKTPRLQ